MDKELRSAYIQLHIAVFIFGFTAILGKLISADHFTLVWHRMWLAAAGFFLIPGFIKTLRQTNVKYLFMLMGIGILVAIHWLTFYGSIKIGDSASLTLGCFGLTSTFTSILEPLIYRKKFVVLDVLLGLLALLGIAIIAYYAPSQKEGNGNIPLAIIVGVFSTFVAALFSTINSTLTNKVDTKVISFAELTGGYLFLCIILLSSFHIEAVLPVNDFKLWPLTSEPKFIQSPYADFIWIALLALVCTNVAFVMNLNAMKRVSAFTANLAINLEPVYGILLAAFIFKEHQFLNLQFYIGAGIILLSVVLHSIIKSRERNK
ncbi:MAG: DMT family transporter [Bacteroidetes bacterium]|nr:DMT family transporter [Bacteroidota bacterium]